MMTKDANVNNARKRATTMEECFESLRQLTCHYCTPGSDKDRIKTMLDGIMLNAPHAEDVYTKLDLFAKFLLDPRNSNIDFPDAVMLALSFSNIMRRATTPEIAERLEAVSINAGDSSKKKSLFILSFKTASQFERAPAADVKRHEFAYWISELSTAIYHPNPIRSIYNTGRAPDDVRHLEFVETVQRGEIARTAAKIRAEEFAKRRFLLRKTVEKPEVETEERESYNISPRYVQVIHHWSETGFEQ